MKENGEFSPFFYNGGSEKSVKNQKLAKNSKKTLAKKVKKGYHNTIKRRACECKRDVRRKNYVLEFIDRNDFERYGWRRL